MKHRLVRDLKWLVVITIGLPFLLAAYIYRKFNPLSVEPIIDVSKCNHTNCEIKKYWRDE
jgi:hypothetical protein